MIVYSLDSESGTLELDTLDFAWHYSAFKHNGTCVIERRLPDKDIFGIRTGQVDRDGNLLWEVEHWFEEKTAPVTSGELAARSFFDVYIGADSLTYIKEPCVHSDTEAKFFLYLSPVDVNDLPDDRQQYGFDNLDFDFEEHGVRFKGKCQATVALPGYDITGIRTGQFLANEDGSWTNLWEEEIRFDE